MAQVDNQRKLFQMASRCVFKNYNDIKNIKDINGEFGNHVLDYDNPHNVNKTQIGLGNVSNVDTTTTANITDSSNKRFVTDAQRTVISNTSGTNTGDQDLSGLVPKTTTVNGHSLSSNVTVTKSDVGLSNVPNTDCTNPANITQSSDYKFVTDTEKSTWNSKSDFSGSYDDLTDIPSGYTGSITVVTGVDFILMTTTTSTITISNGIITSIV